MYLDVFKACIVVVGDIHDVVAVNAVVVVIVVNVTEKHLDVEMVSVEMTKLKQFEINFQQIKYGFQFNPVLQPYARLAKSKT